MLAYGLGWFSIGLGAMELLASGPLTRSMGMKGKGGLLRLCGLREIVTGIGILSNRSNPAPWIWARVIGDAIDAATLAAPLSRQPRRSFPWFALAAVAMVGAADVMSAGALTKSRRIRRIRRRLVDYSDRSGLPKAPDAMRGIAREVSQTRH
ncbi:MAG TPA: cyclase dehydrase [Ferrovibrio sp.]